MEELSQKQEAVQRLPQEQSTWLVVVSHMKAWIEEEGEPIRPWVVLCTTRSAGFILAAELLPGPPTPAQVLEVLFDCMLEPTPSAGIKPSRPTKIAFTDQELSRAMREGLDAIGVRATFGNPSPEIDFILTSLTERLRGEAGSELPGLLEGEGVTPELAGAFFAAAADLYRAEPWIKLSNSQILAISFPPEGQIWYVTVMGQGGVEYGLVLQRTWDQVAHLFRHLDDPIDGMPREGWHSMSYEPAYNLPFSDLDAIENHGWDVAGEEAYPLA